jgi:autotransporter translocation and assembly factor TamB
MQTAHWREWPRARLFPTHHASLIGAVPLAATPDSSSWTDYVREWLHKQTLAALQGRLNGEVSLGEVTIASWDKVVFHNLSLRQHGVEVLSVPQATLTVQVLSEVFSYFTSSSVHISSLTLTAPALKLVQHPETGWNVTTFFKSSEEPSTVSLYLDSVGIQKARIAGRRATGEEFYLTGLSTEGSLATVAAGMQTHLSTLDFSLDYPGMPTVQWSGGLTYDGTQSPAVLSLAATDLRTAQSHIQVSGTVTQPSSPTLSLTADVERLDVADVQLFAPSVPLQQDLSGTVRAVGPLSALHVGATVQTPDGRAALAVTANLNRTPPHYQGAVDVEHFTVEKVLDVTDVSGQVNGHVSFAGETVTTAQSTLRAHASDLSVYGRKIGDLAVTGDMAKGQVALTGEAQGPVGQVQWRSQAELGTPLTYEVSLNARSIAAAKLTQSESAPPTRLNFDARVKGSGTTLQNINSTAQVTLLPSQVGTLTDVHGRAEAALAQSQVTLDTLTLAARGATLTAQGRVGDLQTTPSGTITYTVAAQDLSPWLTLAGQQGEGTLRLEGTAAGTLTALQVKGDATLSELRSPTYALQTGEISYAFTQLGSERAQGHVTGEFTDLEAGVSWRTATLNLTLTDTQPAVVQTELIARDEQDRTQRLTTELRYQPERWVMLLKDLTLRLPSGTWSNSGPARFTVHNKTLTVDNFLLRQANSTISADGSLALQGRQNFQVEARRLSLADVGTALGAEPALSGHLNAEIRVQGTAAHPEIMTAVDTGRVTAAGVSYAGLTAEVSYQQRRLEVNATLRQDTNHTLTVEGGVPLSLQWAGEWPSPALGEADLRVHSAGLSVAFLDLFSPSLQNARGTVTLNVQLRGPLRELVPSGTVELHQGQVHVTPLAVTFTGVQAQAELAPGAVQITQLVIQAGDGQLTGTGSLGLQQYAISDFDLALRAKRFRVIDTHEYAAAVSGQVNGSGSWQQPVFQGKLELVDTVLRPNFTVLTSGPPPRDPTIRVVETTQELKTVPRPQPPEQPEESESQGSLAPALYQRLGLEVMVTVPRGTWIYLNDGTVEIQGKIEAQKVPGQEMRLVGAIEAVRGWYTYHGRKLRLQHGRMDFTGATPVDPALDVIAQHTVQDYQIDTVVGGTMRQPTLTLRSEPALEQADILSLLVFGRTTDALNGGEQTKLQSQVLQAAAGYLANDLRQSVAEALGIQNLELEVGQTLGQTRIGVGQYVTEDIYLSASQAIGDTASPEFTAEYNLGQHWQLQASETAKGGEAIDLFWHKRY